MEWQDWYVTSSVEELQRSVDRLLRKRFKQKYNTQKPVKWAIIQSHRLLVHQDVNNALEEFYEATVATHRSPVPIMRT